MICKTLVRNQTKVEAEKRQKEHGGTAPNKPKNTGGKSSTSDNGKTRDKSADTVGWSGKTFKNKEMLVDLATAEELAEWNKKGKPPKSLKEKVKKEKQKRAREKAKKANKLRKKRLKEKKEKEQDEILKLVS